MSDQYNSEERANNYDNYSKKSITIEHIRIPTVRRVLGGDLSGRRCVDLACGSGLFTRVLADMNPSEVVGVDLSQHMVDLAIQQSQSDPKYTKITYVAKDCSQPLGLGHFDVVFSGHFLNYAETEEHLAQMVRSMFDSTRPGGLCIGFCVSPFLKECDFPKIHKYGIEYTKTKNQNEYNTRLFVGHVNEGKLMIEFSIHVWKPSAYEKSFQEAGFVDFEWINFEIDSTYNDTTGFLKDFIDLTPTIIFKASRPLK